MVSIEKVKTICRKEKLLRKMTMVGRRMEISLVSAKEVRRHLSLENEGELGRMDRSLVSQEGWRGVWSFKKFGEDYGQP